MWGNIGIAILEKTSLKNWLSKANLFYSPAVLKSRSFFGRLRLRIRLQLQLL